MKSSSAVASLEKKHGSWQISGQLCANTVARLAENGKQVISEVQQDAQGTICFDFADTEVQDASAVAMLLEWIRFARYCKLHVTFMHLPHKLKIMAELGGVEAMIQQQIIE